MRQAEVGLNLSTKAVFRHEGAHGSRCRVRPGVLGAGRLGNVSDVVEANNLLHDQESGDFADAGYQGAVKRAGNRTAVAWHVAMRMGKRKALVATDAAKCLEASVRANAK